MAKKPVVRTRRDRWADWAVIAVLVAALLLGWGIKAAAEGQTDTYTDAATGLMVRYPKGWLLRSDPKLAFHAVDPGAGAFKTTYQVRAWPVDPAAPSLGVVLNDASLSRAQGKTAYRLFDILDGEEIGGRPSMEATYVYVVESADPFAQHMPVVVMGLDIAVLQGERAYVFSLLADKDAFAEAERDFRRFVEAATIPE